MSGTPDIVPEYDGDDATETRGSDPSASVDRREFVDETETESVDDLEQPEAPAREDVEEETVELTDDDLGGGLFSGVEDAGDDDASSSIDAADETDDALEGDETDDAVDPLDGLEGNSEAMESAINEGCARLGTIGLTDADFEDSNLTKEGLEEELSETFQAFRLGYFGSRFVDEHILAPDDGDIDPTWGLLGASMMAVAMIVWLRPDGDAAVAKARDSIGGIAGKVSA